MRGDDRWQGLRLLRSGPPRTRLGNLPRIAAFAVALASFAAFSALPSRAVEALPPGAGDAITQTVREVLHDQRADAYWGAEPPTNEIADRGEPVAVTVLGGAGHALTAFS